MKNHMFNFVVPFRSLFFSIAVMVLLMSCMDEGDDFVSQPMEVAYVSIYHASPDAPAFDILVDGRVINRNPFDYTSYSGYLNFFTGQREIQFNIVNADNAVIDTTFNLEDGKAYSLFAIDRFPEVEALLVVDSAGTPAQGKAMVRFVHLSPDAPAFDVALNETTPLFAGMAFRESSDFQEIDADTYTINLKNEGQAETELSVDDVEILPGRFYTIVTRGFAIPPEGNDNLLSVEILD